MRKTSGTPGASSRVWQRRDAREEVGWITVKDGRQPTVEEIVKHLRELPCDVRERAEKYIRKAPRQIDTPYRRRIEAEFHWEPER